jgi:type I restriction enzyme S subunit
VSLPQKPFGSVCRLVNGKAFKATDWSKSGAPIIRIQNLNGSDKPFNYWAGALDKQVIVNTGDLLLAWSGTPGTSFGAHIWGGPNGVLNQHIFRCDLNENAITKKWARIAVNHRLHRLIEQAHGGVGIQHVTRGMVEELEIPLPPIEEQRRIATVLDKADELRAKRRAALTELESLTDSIFLEMFGDPASNPKLWTAATLGDALTAIRNGANAEQNKALGGWPITRIETIADGTINPRRVRWIEPDDSLNESFQLHPGDILFSHINSVDHIGKTAIYSGNPTPLIHGINLLRLSPKRDSVDPLWLLHLLKHDAVRMHFRTRCKRAVNQASLNQQDIKSLSIYLPPISLQHEFARRVTTLEALKAKHRTALAELDTLFASLQHRAFRGEL